MTDPRHPTGPGNPQPGFQPPQRAPGLHPPHQVNPGGLHPAHQVTPGLHPNHQPTPGSHPHQPPQRVPPMAAPASAPRPAPTPDEPIALVEELLEDDLAAAPTIKKIKAFGEDGGKKHHDWKRKSAANGQGACRVRSFHGKYSDQGLQYLDDAVNEWLDANPDVEVKFVTSTVGVFEGKIREPALVLNLWY